MKVLINKFKESKILLCLLAGLSVILSSYLLIGLNIWSAFDLSVIKITTLIIAISALIILILIAWLDKKINKTDWLLTFVRKELIFLVAIFGLFILSFLKSKNLIPSSITFFLSLSICALFLTIILSFLKDFLKRADSRINNSIYLVFALIIAFIGLYTYLGFLRFNAGLSNLYDLGNMEQAVWNTLHGNLLRTTTSNLTTRLGGHFDIFLVALTPFYALWSSPKLLIFIQTFIAGLGALPLFLITKKLLKSSLAGLVFALAYLISPILGAAMLFDFHAVSLVAAFLLFAFYFLLERRYLYYFIFIILALACKEEISLLILVLGIYIYFKHNKKIGMATAGLGLAWFILAFLIVIPHFSQGAGNIFLTERYNFLSFDQGPTIKSLITHPGQIIINIWNIKKLTYLLYLILPLGALMIFSPFTLLGLPSFLLYISTSFEPMFSGGYHYSAPLLFYLLIGSVFGVKFLVKRKKKNNFLYSLLILVFFSSLFFGYKYGLSIWGPRSDRFNVTAAINDARIKKGEIRTITEIVPRDTSISTSAAAGVFFAARKNIYLFPRLDDAYYVILDQPGPISDKSDYMEHLRKMAKIIQGNEDYKIIYKGSYYLVAKKK